GRGEAMRAGGQAHLAGARFAGPVRRLERLAAVEPGIEMVPKIFSLALRIAGVASGALDGALAGPNSHDWDLAAADLLVHEAGGALTSLDGRPPIYNRPHPVHGALVAAGRARHAALMALVRAGTICLGGSGEAASARPPRRMSHGGENIQAIAAPGVRRRALAPRPGRVQGPRRARHRRHLSQLRDRLRGLEGEGA